MALNKVRLLDEDQLLGLLNQNGYQGIANIISNRNINGQRLLELSECQTGLWRLSVPQKKGLFSFIAEVKENPFIILKKPVTKLNKPALPSPVIPKSPRLPPKKTSEQNEFKLKLGMIYSTNSSPSISPSPTPSNVPDHYLPRSTRPVPIPQDTEEDSLSNVEYENVVQLKGSEDYGYLTSNELETDGYIKSNVAKMINKSINKKINGMSIINTQHSNDEPKTSRNKYSSSTENLIKMPPSSQRKFPPPPPSNNETVGLKKSPGTGRPPIPVPKEQKDIRQSVSLEDVRREFSDSEFDSDNNDDLLPLNKKVKNRNNTKMVDGYLDLKAINVPQTSSAKSTPDFPSIQKTKSTPTINDLQNNEEQLKRQNSLFGSLSRLFSKKGKTRTNLLNNQVNYENHMMENEVPSVRIDKIYSFKNRPLPKVPKSETITEFADNKQEQMMEKSLYENLKNRSVENVTKDVVDHKNTHSSNTPSIPNNKKLNLQDELALKLSKALKVREAQSSQHIKRNFAKMKTPSGSEDEDDDGNDDDDEADIHIYGNIDNHRNPQQTSLQPSRSILRNNSNSNIENHEFIATPQPYYENLKNSQSVHKQAKPIETEMNVGTTEEESEYVGSLFNIHNQKFFRNTDREGARNLLNYLPDGAFLFRPSQKYFLVLTLKYKGKCYNLGIERTVNNKIRLHADTRSISPEFGSLQDFADYFTKEAVTFRDNFDNLVEIFLNPNGYL